MDNYLNHRWPEGPGIQPPPVPSPRTAAPVPVKRKKHTARWWLVRVVCIVLCLALLGGASFWAVSSLAEALADVERPNSGWGEYPAYPGVRQDNPDWSVDDLPWGSPDPSVQLSVEPDAGSPLSGREIHQKIQPSIVYVEAQEKGRFGFGAAHAGTGVIVTQSGYVLTNYHVIDESAKIQVMLLTDQTHTYYDAEVIGFDEEFDIAVLKFEAPDLIPADLGDSDVLAVGDQVYAEGNPMGNLLGSMTDGIVSALNRDDEVDGNGLGLIQTSAALNPGNSGGALLNDSGQVVGITSAKITGLIREDGESVDDAAVIEGIGLAIPISDILPFVNRILATGKSWRPSIGITCYETVEDGQPGIKVSVVDEGTPAFEAGLEVDDFIIAANGEAVGSLAELRRVLYRTGVDGMVECTVVRDGGELEVSFALIDRMEAEDGEEG